MFPPPSRVIVLKRVQLWELQGKNHKRSEAVLCFPPAPFPSDSSTYGPTKIPLIYPLVLKTILGNYLERGHGRETGKT